MRMVAGSCRTSPPISARSRPAPPASRTASPIFGESAFFTVAANGAVNLPAITLGIIQHADSRRRSPSRPLPHLRSQPRDRRCNSSVTATYPNGSTGRRHSREHRHKLHDQQPGDRDDQRRRAGHRRFERHRCHSSEQRWRDRDCHRTGRPGWRYVLVAFRCRASLA